MSGNVAPIDEMRRNPRTPKVEGKIHENASQNQGMLDWGQLIPVMKSKGTDVNTTRSITFSRYLTRHDIVKPKNITASRNGTISPMSVCAVTSDTKWNILGTQRVM